MSGLLAMVQVGAVEGGIAAAAWSPDGGLLIILSAFGQLLMLNQVMHHRESPL